MSLIPERPGQVRIQPLNADGEPAGEPFEARGEICIQGMYARLTPVRVLGRDNTVIYEGAGEVQRTCGPGSEGRTVLHLEADGYVLGWDLTELSLMYGVSWEHEYSRTDVLEWTDPEPGETIRIPDPPRVVGITVRIDVGPVGACAMRDEILQAHPAWRFTAQDAREAANRLRQQHLTRREARDTLWPDFAPARNPLHPYEIADRVESGRMSPEAARAMAAALNQVSGAAARAGEGLTAFAEAFREQDRLMEETRSEFPHDPLGYGRVHPEGPSRWTPPEDPDEKVRSCP